MAEINAEVPRKRKSMRAMKEVYLVMKGTVESRGKSGGVRYTDRELLNLYEHWADNGVGAMWRMGAQIETAFAVRFEQVLSERNLPGETRTVAIPSAETLKEAINAVGLLLNIQAQILAESTQG